MGAYLDVDEGGAVRVDDAAGVSKVWLVTSPGGANLTAERLSALIEELSGGSDV